MKLLIGYVFLCIFTSNVFAARTREIAKLYGQNLWVNYYSKILGTEGPEWSIIHLESKDIWPAAQSSSSSSRSIVSVNPAFTSLTRSPSIDLRKSVLNGNFLDTQQPEIVIHEWYNVPAFNQADLAKGFKTYRLTIKMVYQSDLAVTVTDKKITVYPSMAGKWANKEIVLKNYKKGLWEIELTRRGAGFRYGQYISILKP